MERGNLATGVRVTGLDHIVLVCADLEASLAFYCDELGLAGERVEAWRAGEVPFPSVRIDATTIIDLFDHALTDRLAAHPEAGGSPGGTATARPNMEHLCFTVEPVDLHELAASGRFEVVRGPAEHLFGAQGYATSLYVADPDGNTVELRSYH